jgi:hypothetical protein
MADKVKCYSDDIFLQFVSVKYRFLIKKAQYMIRIITNRLLMCYCCLALGKYCFNIQV